jgi:hypothetical protein
VLATAVSDATGYATFPNLRAGTYEMSGSAVKHIAARKTVDVSPGASTAVTIFLARATVTYTWTVTPTSVPDVYTINVTAGRPEHINCVCSLVGACRLHCIRAGACDYRGTQRV